MTRTLSLALMTALLVALTAAPTRGARATSDPDLAWFTLETSHFLVHYPEGLEAFARDTARHAEEAHQVLAPLIDWVPGAKTHMVVSDFGDSANGSARIIPYNLIRIFAASPGLRSTLADYDDWLRLLVYHEYVHILQIDIIAGIPAFLNAILGKSLAPNQVLPRWFTEGLATYYESQRTGAGRVRSSIFRMMLRADVLEDALIGLDAMSHVPVRWPGARTWYLYGSHFVAWIASVYGEDAVNDFSHAYANRLVPYGLNVVARAALGADWVELYAAWEAALTGSVMADYVAIRAEGALTPVERITRLGFQSDHVRRRPNTTQLSYMRNDGRQTPIIALYDEATGEHQRLFENFGDGRHAWGPDGRWLIATRLSVIKRVYTFMDLVRVDAESGEQTMLTRGLRAREPTISPDGRRVVFVAWRQGTSDLMQLDLETGALEVLHRGEGRELLATPSFTPDGRAVVLSRFYGTPRGQRDLFLFDLERRSFSAQLTDDDAQDLEPVITPEGDAVVWVSDRTGIFELYEAPLSGSGPARRLTRNLTGLFSPQVEADGSILTTVYGSRGFDVGRVPADAVLEEAPAPESYERPRIAYSEPDISDVQARPYRPWRYLWPRTWLPSFTAGAEGNTLGVVIGGSDPVGFHGWFASLLYDLDAEELSYFLSYTFGRLGFDLNVSHGRNVITRSFRAESRARPYREEQLSTALNLYVPIPRVPGSHALSLNLNATRYAISEPWELQHDPLDLSVAPPEIGWFNSVAMSWFFGDIESYFFSISPELGFRGSLGLRWMTPLLGADHENLSVNWSAAFYVPNPLLFGHVLATQLTGGIAMGDTGRRGIWSIGGIPQQDPITALIEGFGVSGTRLRGYLPGATAGDQYHLLNVEYRFPIWDPQVGYHTLPFFLGRIFGALFVDYGGAFFGDFDFEKLELGIGAELRFTTTLGYFFPATWRLGYAHGFDPEIGVDHVYLVIGGAY